jgi:hypothetical protein
VGTEQPHRSIAVLSGGCKSIAKQYVAIDLDTIGIQDWQVGTGQGQPGQAGTDQKYGVLEIAIPQFDSHSRLNVREIQRPGDPSTMQPHA